MTSILAQKLCGGNAFYSRQSLVSCLRTQKQMGVTQLELWPYASHLWIDHYSHQDTTLISEWLSANELQPFCLYPSLYQYSLCAPNKTMQKKATEEYYTQCLNFAVALNISFLCVDARGGCRDMGKDSLLELFANAVARLNEESLQKGISLLIETTPGWQSEVCNSISDLQKVIAFSGPEIGVVMNTAAAFESGESPKEWFESLGSDKIKHVRLLDARNDGYRIWGQGVYSPSRILEDLEMLNYRRNIGIQANTGRYDFMPVKSDQTNRAAMLAALEKIKTF